MSQRYTPVGINPVPKDSDIREPLFTFLELTFGKVRILEEKRMGSSRADVVMITPDAICGIEIKSDADTYTRLAGQVKDYDKYYDKNIIVVGTTHAHHVHEHVPAHWGIITVEMVDGAMDFYQLRKPLDNPKVTWKRKLEILWRPELAALQQQYEMPKYKEKSKNFVIEKMIEWIERGKIDAANLQSRMAEILFERDYTGIEAELAEYRRGEIAKQLETENDPARQIELMMKQQTAKVNLKARTRRKHGYRSKKA